MEILFVTHKYPPAVGGMEKQSFELITRMHGYTTVHQLVYDGREGRLQFFFKLGKRISELCARHPAIGLVHFNDALLGAVALHHRGFDHLLKTVTVHGLDVVFPSRYYRSHILPRFNGFDRVFSVSRATAAACIARGIDADRLVVINNGVDNLPAQAVSREEVNGWLEREYGLQLAGRRLLVAVGRPVKRKGFSWFIESVLPHLPADRFLLLVGPLNPPGKSPGALARWLPARIRHALTLLMAWPGDEQRIHELGDTGRYAFAHLGKLPGNRLRHLLSVADTFVMPNIPVEGDMEGFGLVCLEAGLQGAEVVAAAEGGICDAVHQGRNGFLLETAHAAAWIAKLGEEPLPGSDKAREAEARVAYIRDTFSWDRMTREYYEEMRLLFEKEKPGYKKAAPQSGNAASVGLKVV